MRMFDSSFNGSKLNMDFQLDGAGGGESKIGNGDKKLTAADQGKGNFTPLRAAKKALETPAHNEGQYPTVYPDTSTGRRTALAQWITSPKNPLTARVAVNHVWLRHFGEPLVESVDDFGLRAKPPAQSTWRNSCTTS